MFKSTKTYNHNIGLSCAFRQWRATSHCNKLHGYAIAVKLTFASYDLDERQWVVDFGGLKDVKLWLETTFDHKTLVAYDDPHYTKFVDMTKLGIIDMVTLPHTGCEAFSKHIFEYVESWLKDNVKNGAWLESVEVIEHGANSALYVNPKVAIGLNKGLHIGVKP